MPLGLHALTRPNSLLLPTSHPSISLLPSILLRSSSFASRIVLAACIAFGIVVLFDVHRCLVGGPTSAGDASNPFHSMP